MYTYMGNTEALAQSRGVLPNGLLNNVSGSMFGELDAHRWQKAEAKAAELIDRIKPNQPSEKRREAVADYVKRLIMRSFPCQVFAFGSVPLRTYLPDGDIDLSAFSQDHTLKEKWASQVRDMLQNEEKNEIAEFHVKDVQLIQAEVKIVKCLVENIVVDISFLQLGGLSTLCFLEQVDLLMNQNHILKRSIILIKAWCYYESRILGAHHGLISTYALETLVLYIFHVFNSTFTGPLEVLYRFLEFFSNFDWDNYCVSLWGPVPISSLPDVTAGPPCKDSGELLLSKLFLQACSAVYDRFPDGQENQGQEQPFISKFLNVIDPLRANNNLGRSVSKGNFFRIRSAFAFGAKRLARLLDCAPEDIPFELNQFFMNTWDRHGSGNRPDAPINSSQMRQLNHDLLQGSSDLSDTSSGKKINDNSSVHDIAVEGSHSFNQLPTQCASYPRESILKEGSVPRALSQKIGSRVSEQTQNIKIDPTVPIDRVQRSSNFNHVINKALGKHPFARTMSSPELKDTCSDASSQTRCSKISEYGKTQTASSRNGNTRIKNGLSKTLDVSLDFNSGANSYVDDPGSSSIVEEPVTVLGSEAIHQEEQDRVNMIAASLQNFGGQALFPLNFPSAQVPMAISPSLMASMAQRNLVGNVPANFPFITPSWASNLQFPQGMIPLPLAQYFPGIGLSSISEGRTGPENENSGCVEISSIEADGELWQEHDSCSNGELGRYDGNLEMLSAENQYPSTSAGLNSVPASRFGVSGSSVTAQQKLTKDRPGPTREDSDDDRKIPGSARSSSVSQAGSMRSRGSSECSLDEVVSSAKISKTTREKRGRKSSPSSSSHAYGNGLSISDRGTAEPDNRNGDWSSVSSGHAEMAERSASTQSAGAPSVSRHHLHGFGATETSTSCSFMPIAPIVLGPGPLGSWERFTDNFEGAPLTFYPAGPPIPFLTMLPVYNLAEESSTSDTLPSHAIGEEGSNSRDPGQVYNSPEVLEDQETLSTSSSTNRISTPVPSEEHKPDILSGDYASHWQNLQYARFCQNPRLHGAGIHQSPVVVPPMHLQGRISWDGPGPFNMNVFSQMGYGPRFVPVAPPVPSASNNPNSIYQRFADELPRHRSGTGTYLPSPKASARERYSSSTRRSNYNYDRNEHHADNEGSRTSNHRTRNAGRSRNRGLVDKSASKVDRLAADNGRFNRSWGRNRNESQPAYHPRNGPLLEDSSQSTVSSVMYSVPGMNQSRVSSNGFTVPSVVMFYPYGHNPVRDTTAGQLEFGSFGPVGFTGTELHEASRVVESTHMRGN